MWDGEHLLGPVPTLFSEDSKRTEDGLMGNPGRAHADMQKIARNFLVMEHVDLADATALVQKPR